MKYNEFKNYVLQNLADYKTNSLDIQEKGIYNGFCRLHSQFKLSTLRKIPPQIYIISGLSNRLELPTKKLPQPKHT